MCPLKGGGFLLTRSEDVGAALSAPELGNAPSRFSVLHPKNREKHVAASVAAHILPFLDAPDHRDARQGVSRAFYQVFRGGQPEIDAMASLCVAALEGRGDVDLVEGPARDFACRTIAAFVGIQGESEQLKETSQAFFRLFAPVQSAQDLAQTNAQLERARIFVGQALTDRRGDGAMCLLNAMSSADNAMEDAQIVDMAILVLADGIENIEAGIGQVMISLQSEPCECIDEGYVREVLRLNSPALMIPRVCRDAHAIKGVDIAAGTPVFLGLASANLDPEGGGGDAFDATHGREGALTFGAGRHSCIGEPLALAMIGTFCEELRKADAKIQMDGRRFAPVFGHRWVRGVTVRVDL